MRIAKLLRSRYVLLAVLAALCACPLPAPTVISLISTAIDAGAAVLSSYSVIPPSSALYVKQGEEALAFAATELATTDSDLVKISSISAKILAIAQPDLTNAPTPVIVSVFAFAAALNAVLDYIQAGKLKLSRVPGQPALVLLTPGYSKTLRKLHNEALATSVKAGEMVK